MRAPDYEVTAQEEGPGRLRKPKGDRSWRLHSVHMVRGSVVCVWESIEPDKEKR